MRAPTYLDLTSRGRRTALPREIEIWFTRFEGRFYVIAEHRERARWVQNLRAEPRAGVRVGGQRFRARARIIEARKEPGLAREIRARSTRKYGWGDGLIVELVPARRPRGPD